MRNVCFIRPIKSARGKLFKGSNIYLRENRVTGACHTGTIRNPYKGPSSAAQQETRNRFRRVMARVMEHLNDPAEKSRLEREFAAQNEVGTLVGFVYRKVKNEVA